MHCLNLLLTTDSLCSFFEVKMSWSVKFSYSVGIIYAICLTMLFLWLANCDWFISSHERENSSKVNLPVIFYIFFLSIWTVRHLENENIGTESALIGKWFLTPGSKVFYCSSGLEVTNGNACGDCNEKWEYFKNYSLKENKDFIWTSSPQLNGKSVFVNYLAKWRWLNNFCYTHTQVHVCTLYMYTDMNSHICYHLLPLWNLFDLKKKKSGHSYSTHQKYWNTPLFPPILTWGLMAGFLFSDEIGNWAGLF